MHLTMESLLRPNPETNIGSPANVYKPYTMCGGPGTSKEVCGREIGGMIKQITYPINLWKILFNSMF